MTKCVETLDTSLLGLGSGRRLTIVATSKRPHRGKTKLLHEVTQ